MKLSLQLLLILGFVVTSGCVREPVGPAERLGRSIDQLTKDLQYADETWGVTEQAQGDKTGVSPSARAVDEDYSDNDSEMGNAAESFDEYEDERALRRR